MDDLTHRGEVILLADLQAPSLADAACAGLRIATGTNPSTPACSDEMDMVCGNHLDG